GGSRRGRVVHPGVVVGALNDEREQDRLLGDVRVRETPVDVTEAQARRNGDENGDDSRLEEEKQQPPRVSEELDHRSTTRYGTTTVPPDGSARFCCRSPRSTTAL